jgi:RNA 2',3'-cyclic 3'-phosphodiesterase
VAEGPDRLFVGVPVSPEALAACAALLDGVRAVHAGRGVRWVHTGSLHLTLRFLGALPGSRIAAIGDAIETAVRGRAPFQVELAGAGAFPGDRRPRALWLRIEGGADELGSLARSLAAPLAATGLDPEPRAFQPHLTVARTDAAGPEGSAAVAAALREAAANWSVAFTVDRVVLYRSHLGGGPPRYEPLRVVSLAG